MIGASVGLLVWWRGKHRDSVQRTATQSLPPAGPLESKVEPAGQPQAAAGQDPRPAAPYPGAPGRPPQQG